MKLIVAMAAGLTLAASHIDIIAAPGPMPEHLEKAVQKAIQKRDFDTAIKMIRPYADGGNKDAQFSVAIMFILKGYILRTEGSFSPKISKLEASAVTWLKKAAANNNQEAADLYAQVRKRGTTALYFPSIEHLLQTDDDPYGLREYKWSRQPDPRPSKQP